ncbi:MAG TPA: sugar phosphate isomerase/epimerase family protein [Candidatus Acidoferrum sp.]|nr:sugar phosphate isomerase/epimerase family protein [Candidatus Acidoferrum sp.]
MPKLSYAVALPDCKAKKMQCFRGDLDSICAQLRDLGYDGVELFSRNPKALDQAAIVGTIKRYGLAVPELSTGPSSEDGLGLTDPDPAIRQAARERLRDYVDLAACWGAQIHLGRIRGSIPDGPGASDAWKLMKEGFLETAEYGRPRGVRVLLEPQCRFQGNALLSVVEGIAFVRELNHQNLGIVADTFHMNIEDVCLPASLMAAAPWLWHVHFADTNRWYPGAGHLNFREVLEALKLIGYERFITMEIEQRPDSPTAARRAIQAARALLDTL